MKLFLIILIFIISSCTGYKTANLNEKHIYCIKEVNINIPEPTLKDTATKYISDAVIESNNILECSEKTDRYINININSLNIYSVGYSPSQRANIYNAYISLSFILTDKSGNNILNKEIKEITEYTGTGLLSERERRYAIEEIFKLIKIRVISLLRM
ncbi:hypothetical protein JCM14244_13320 [Venenivibrio stagnispumantis]|uniref:Lipoprotein n=1 Tax=Venenivibrio stagnispumantis TaxID=407998 RepID=A0AA46ADX7_9AQUI|nr:hypothetical protein [Venenivibrio stagnispumantis]MCW4573112.1 hypothetical protein [Venenivibrio stagnispumantis]SMP09024.1 hypothetical protein SAMN06264868_10664 [Venenivibrio stagnispumantis]